MIKYDTTTDKMSSTSNQEVISNNNGGSEIFILPITRDKLNEHNFLVEQQRIYGMQQKKPTPTMKILLNSLR